MTTPDSIPATDAIEHCIGVSYSELGRTARVQLAALLAENAALRQRAETAEGQLGDPSRVECLYFGCWSEKEIGHFLFFPNHQRPRDDVSSLWPLPKGFRDYLFDAGPFSASPKYQLGVAETTHIRGWTVMALWDRSADKRFAANAAFIARGIWSEAQMWRIANARFPQQFARIKPAFDAARTAEGGTT